MKKSLIALTTIMILSASMSLSAYAMTAEEVTAKTPTSYTAGTQSIYGPSLNQDQLNAVAQATADFMTANITEGMDTDQKIKAAYDYIKTRTTYVDWNAVTGANTAYTLVTGQGACSGMCRSMKALCDAMGIECYHVHSTSNDHQWNLVRYGDGILYHVDIDANKSAGQDIIYKSLTHPLPYDTSAYPAVGQEQTQGQLNGMSGEHTHRASENGIVATLEVNDGTLPEYYDETRGSVNCYILDNQAISFRIPSNKNVIDHTNHEVWVYGLKDSNGISFALGEPKVYQFEYDKNYSLDFTGNHSTANSLSDYCKNENIIIVINLIDKNATGSTTGIEFKAAYATSNSIKK